MLDWRTGIETSCRKAGRPLREGEFDRIIDAQGEAEQGAFLDYATVTRRSLVDVLGLDATKAAAIAAEVGSWPLYPDAPALKALMRLAPCGAMTNSDRAHGEDVQTRLGFRLSAWLCAEDAGVYKPNPAFWTRMASLCGIEPSADWWHVSAYADYDLDAASRLGLTTVFVSRPHARQGAASHAVSDLHRFVDLLDEVAGQG